MTFAGCILLAAAFVAPEPPNLMPWATRERTLAPLRGHVQGMCVTADAVYMSLDNGIYMYDWRGNFLKMTPACKHTGDLCFWRGRVYAAVCIPKDQPLRGRIDVYDAELNFVTNAVFEKSADGIACLGGVLYVGLGPNRDPANRFRGNWFGKFDAKTLAPVGEPFFVDHGFPTWGGVQNIATDGERLYVNFYTPEPDDTCFFVFDRDFKVLGCANYGWRHGMDVISWRGWDDPGSVKFAFVTTLAWMDQKDDILQPPPQALVQYAEWKDGRMRDISDHNNFIYSPKYQIDYRRKKAKK